jgi:Methyltransferase domain
MGNLSRRVAASRFARAAAFPVRASMVASYDSKVLGRSARWLVASREHTNFTYDLTERNQDHLACWVANLTKVEDVDQVRGYMRELDEDEDLKGHIRQATMRSDRRGLADRDVRFGRRVGWYAITRALQPEHVVETGTDKGLGTCVFAAALLRNGHGRVTTVDVNPDSGYLITGRYAGVVDRVIGDSIEVLRSGVTPVDLFMHDSWHTYEHESGELAAVASRLSADAMVLSDNAHESDALLRWAERSARRFSFFREVPSGHWWPGDGIGAATNAHCSENSRT